MYRPPNRPQRSPGAPRAPGRFTSLSPGWGYPGPRSPYGGSGHRGGSPRGSPYYSPCSPVFSPGAYRGHGDGSPAGFSSRSRGFGGQKWPRSGGFRRPPSVSPASSHSYQSSASASSVEKYFSPSMLQDPWADLKPVSVSEGRRQL